MSETSKQRQQPPPRPARGSLWFIRRALRPSRTGLWSTRATKPLRTGQARDGRLPEHRTLPGHTTPREAPSVGESERRIGTGSGDGDKTGPISPLVQEIDPSWKPPASMSQGIEGAILSNQAAIRQAEARLRELSSRGIGEGPFARESIPARGPGQRISASERREINNIGSAFGCHTCGTTEPGTKSGNFIPDHQLPSSIARPGSPQRLYPHCQFCSDAQGGHVRPFRRR
jgi:hypothetical protein